MRQALTFPREPATNRPTRLAAVRAPPPEGLPVVRNVDRQRSLPPRSVSRGGWTLAADDPVALDVLVVVDQVAAREPVTLDVLVVVDQVCRP